MDFSRQGFSDHKIEEEKNLASTTVKDNELIPLQQQQQQSSNSREMYSPTTTPQHSTILSSPEGYPNHPQSSSSTLPKIDIAATTSIPPQPQPQSPQSSNPNAQRVYVWDCYRSFCVSDNRLMNRIITWAIIFFNVLLFVSFFLFVLFCKLIIEL